MLETLGLFGICVWGILLVFSIVVLVGITISYIQKKTGIKFLETDSEGNIPLWG